MDILSYPVILAVSLKFVLQPRVVNIGVFFPHLWFLLKFFIILIRFINMRTYVMFSSFQELNCLTLQGYLQKV